MGNNVTASPSRGEVNEYIYCSQITHSAVADLYEKADDPRDIQVINHTMTLISQVTARHGDRTWRDAQIAIYGYQFKAFLYSGDRTNKFVVHFDGTSNPTYSVQERGWRLRIRDTLTSIWESFKTVVGGALAIGSKVAPYAIGY